MEDEPGDRRPRSRGIHLLAALAFASVTAHAALDPHQCAFADCAIGDVVVTAPTDKSGPRCASQGATIYGYYLAHPMLPAGPERDRVETDLRLRAGGRTAAEALRSCSPVPAGQRVTIIERGAAKTGLLQVAPSDGGAP